MHILLPWLSLERQARMEQAYSWFGYDVKIQFRKHVRPAQGRSTVTVERHRGEMRYERVRQSSPQFTAYFWPQYHLLHKSAHLDDQVLFPEAVSTAIVIVSWMNEIAAGQSPGRTASPQPGRSCGVAAASRCAWPAVRRPAGGPGLWLSAGLAGCLVSLAAAAPACPARTAEPVPFRPVAVAVPGCGRIVVRAALAGCKAGRPGRNPRLRLPIRHRNVPAEGSGGRADIHKVPACPQACSPA
jgi:hypothetical protein